MGRMGVGPRPLPLVAAATLWMLAVGFIATGAFADRGERASGPEATVLAYSAAVERGDLEAALSQLIPSARQTSASWVAWQMGNHYRILESAVRSAPLTDQLRGAANRDQVVVVVNMEIEGKGNPAWRTVVEVPAQRVDGKWLLSRPPLEGL